MSGTDRLIVHPSGRIPVLYAVVFLCLLAAKTFVTWDWQWFELSYRLLLGCGTLFIGYLYLSRVTSVYEINALEISMSVGIFSKKRRAAPVSRVTNFEIDRPFFKRLFGLADLNVDTAGGTDIELQLTEMNKADADAFSRFLTWHLGQQKISDADDNQLLRAQRTAAVARL